MKIMNEVVDLYIIDSTFNIQQYQSIKQTIATVHIKRNIGQQEHKYLRKMEVIKLDMKMIKKLSCLSETLI